MRTPLNINDGLSAGVEGLTGIKKKMALIRLGLEAWIARESAKRLAALGGKRKRVGEGFQAGEGNIKNRLKGGMRFAFPPYRRWGEVKKSWE